MRSSLNKHRINTLPDVYHRPQQGSGVKCEPTNPRFKSFDTHDFKFPSYENPNVNLLKSFEPVYGDNLIATRNFVVNYNRDLIRKTGKDTRPVQDVGLLAKHWQWEVELSNICGRCKNPIRTFTASILRLPVILKDVNPVSRKSEDVKGLEKLLADYREAMQTRTQKRTVSNHLWKVEFRGEHFNQSKPMPTVTYAYCKSYYVPYTRNDGRLGYRYEDGTGRHIEVREQTRVFTYNKSVRDKTIQVSKERRLPYFVQIMPDGTEIPTTDVHPTFTAFHKKCSCMFREYAKIKKGK